MTVGHYMQIKPRLREVITEALGFTPTDRQLFDIITGRRHFCPLTVRGRRGGAA